MKFVSAVGAHFGMAPRPRQMMRLAQGGGQGEYLCSHSGLPLRVRYLAHAAQRTATAGRPSWNYSPKRGWDGPELPPASDALR